MSNFIGFLEKMGGNASLRHADPAQVQRAMKGLGNAQADALRGVPETMYCATFMVKPPQKRPGKRRNPRAQSTVRH